MTGTKINSEKFFLTNILSFVTYVLNPRFLIIIAGLVALGSVIFIAPFAGMLLNFLILAVSFKFAVDILLSTSEGSFDPQDVSFSEHGYGVIFQIIVIGILLDILTDYALDSDNNAISVFILFIIPFFMPAIYMVLAYTGSLLEALNPVTLIRFVKPWFITYMIFSLFYLITTYIENQGILLIAMNMGSFETIYILSVFIMIFFAFLNFHIMGFLIYQNFGDEDDYEETSTTPKNGSGYHHQQTQKPPENANPIFTRIQNLIETENADEALAIIKELQKDGDESPELREFKQQALMLLQNQAEIPVGEQIHNFIKQNKIGSAFRLLEEIYAQKETYLEAHESDLGVLAQHAYNSQKFPLVIKLLNGFNKSYPSSQEIVPNFYLIAQVLYKSHNTQNKALMIVNSLIKKYPSHSKIPELKSWAKGIELMQKKPQSYDHY